MTISESSTTEGEQQPERGYTPRETRHALWYIIVAWLFGAAFCSMISGAPFTSFLTDFLKADDFSYGLIMAAGPAAMVFVFLGSYVAERTGRVKRNFLIYTTAHRLLWLGVALIPLLFHQLSYGTRLWVVGLIAFISQAMANYGGAGWSTWMSDIVPRRIAGRYFGYRSQLGLLSMTIASTGVVYLLQRGHNAAWIYVLIFGLAAICGATDILLFIPVREVPRASAANPPTPADILVTPWKNSLFRGFALYTIVSWIAYMMMGPFVWRYCFDPVKKHGLGMSVLEAHVLLTIVPLVAMAWVAPCWGRAIDRFGPKPVLASSALFAILMPFTWVLVHPGMEWIVWVSAVISGLTWPGIDQVNFYMTVKGFPDARRTTYVAAYQVMMGVANMAGSALGGVCATFWQHRMSGLSFLPGWMSHYQLVFLTAIGLRLAAFLFIFPWLKLQGDARYGTVARAIATDLTATLPSGVGARKWRRNAPKP